MTTSDSNVIPSWKRPWSIAEIMDASKCWSLAADAGICELIKSLSTELLTEISQINNNINELSIESRETDVLIQNAFNDFCMLANDHFMENLVEEVSSTALKKVGSKDVLDPVSTNKESKLAQIVPQVSESIKLGLLVLENQFEVLEVQKRAVGSFSLEQQFDDGDGLANTANDSTVEGCVTISSEAIYQPRDPYEHRHLPHLIGTSDFVEDDTLGIGYLDDLDELKSASIDEEIDDDDYEVRNRVPVGAGLSSSEEEDDSETDEFERHGTMPGSMSRKSNSQTVAVKARKQSSSESLDLFANTTKHDSDLDIFEIESAATQQLPESAPPRQLSAQEAMHRQLQERLGLTVPSPEKPHEEARTPETPVNKPFAATLPTVTPRTQRLFSMDDDDSDGDLFSPSNSSIKQEPTNLVSQATVTSLTVSAASSLTKLPSRRVQLLSSSSSEDDIFSDKSKKRTSKKLAVPANTVAATLPAPTAPVNLIASGQSNTIAVSSPRPGVATVKRSAVPFLDTDSDDDDDIFAVKPVAKKDATVSSGIGRPAATLTKSPVDDTERQQTNGTASERNKPVPRTNVQLPLSDSDDDLFNPAKTTLTKLTDSKEAKTPKVNKIASESNKSIPRTKVQLPLSDSDDEDLFNPTKLAVSKEDKSPKFQKTVSQPNKTISDSDDENHSDPLSLILNKSSSKKTESLKRSPILQEVAPSIAPRSPAGQVGSALPASTNDQALSDSDSDSIFGNHAISTHDLLVPSLTKSTVSDSAPAQSADIHDSTVANEDKKPQTSDVQTVQPRSLAFFDDDSDSSDQLFGPTTKPTVPLISSSDSKPLQRAPTATQPETETPRVVEVNATPLLSTNTSVPEEDVSDPLGPRLSTRKLPPGARNLFGNSSTAGTSITDELVSRQNQRRSLSSSHSQATDDEVIDNVVKDSTRPADVLISTASSLSTDVGVVTTAPEVSVTPKAPVTTTSKISQLQNKLAFGPGGPPMFPGGMPPPSRQSKTNIVDLGEQGDGGEGPVVGLDEPAREVKQLVLLTKGRARNMPRRRPPASSISVAAQRPSVGGPKDTQDEVEEITIATADIAIVVVPPLEDRDSSIPDKSEQPSVQKVDEAAGPVSEAALESSDIFANLPSRPERKSKSSRSSNASANRKQSLLKQGASKVPVNVSEIDDIFAVHTPSKSASTTSTKKTKSKPAGNDPLGAI